MIKKPKMLSNKTHDLVSEFRESRGQSQEHSVQQSPPRKGRPAFTPQQSKKTTGSSYYDSFYKKYLDLENTIDSLGTRDLVYYLREIAEEHGQKYVISNMKKDMAIMKRLRENYTTREICGMIEFLYDSEQDYLDKSRISPNLLASQWVNTIYADMQLWVDDKYVPKSKQVKKSKAKVHEREWNSDKKDSSIGEIKL